MGSTKSRRNEAYGRLEELGFGCCRAVCRRCSISYGRVRGTDAIPCQPAPLACPHFQAVAWLSMSIGLSSRAPDHPQSRQVASSEPAQASSLQKVVRYLKTALGGFAQALYQMGQQVFLSLGISTCIPAIEPATASSSVSCKVLDSCTRERRVRALEIPPFMTRNKMKGDATPIVA
jgi:hypothetical protein